MKAIITTLALAVSLPASAYQTIHAPPIPVTMVNGGELHMVASFGDMTRAGAMFIYTPEDIVPTSIMVRTGAKTCETMAGEANIAVMDERGLREYSETGKLPKEAEVTDHEFNQVSFDPRDRAILWTCRVWLRGKK
jgi:hypothetical protein